MVLIPPYYIMVTGRHTYFVSALAPEILKHVKVCPSTYALRHSRFKEKKGKKNNKERKKEKLFFY
jgi:hypothetical protein